MIEKAKTVFTVAVLIALPLATFARVLGHGFVDWDDRTQIYANPDFNPPTPAKVARYWRGPHMNLYLPVTYTLWGGLSAVARLDRPAIRQPGRRRHAPALRRRRRGGARPRHPQGAGDDHRLHAALLLRRPL